MSENGFQDKTEPATPRKREEARKKGQVAKSKELSSIIVLTAAVLYLFFCAKGMTLRMGDMMQNAFYSLSELNSDDHGIIYFFSQVVHQFLWMILPILLILCAVAFLSNYLQTGFIFSVDPLTPKASKIDPIKGLNKIFSLRSLVELAKSILKILIVGWVAFSILKSESVHLIPLMYQSKTQIISFMATVSFELGIKCCSVIALLGILDYLYQKYEFEKDLKMTKQEVKDEFKQTEGDPLVKSRIRSIQREMAKRRMMEEVPKADVVITNPTHIAIALRYETEEGMNAPKIVAKGLNKIAVRIKEIARGKGIPVIENKPLAQNLYRLDLGEEIPPAFYRAVAEILAYVYKLKNKNLNPG